MNLQQTQSITKIMKPLGIIIIILAIIGIPIWYIATQEPLPEEEVISRVGIHWHPELTIVIKGEQQKILENIGLGAIHERIHTHDDSGALHLEMQGLVTKDDLQLGKFFKIWKQQFNSNCIFDYCNGADGKVKMLVNGKENNEFENYHMKDGDKIEIRYE